jgi:hypothetical protein
MRAAVCALGLRNDGMLIQVYCNERTGAVLIPSAAKTEAGFWLSVEPVEVAHADDETSILSGVRKIAALGVRSVPTPARDAFPKPIMLKYAGSKTWSAFVKIHMRIDVEQNADGQFSVQPWRRGESRSYEPDLSAFRVLPIGATLGDAVFEVIQHIKSVRIPPDRA